MTSTPDRSPIWRRDFPVTSEGEDDVTRREFVRFLVLASGTFAASTAAIAAYTSLRSVNEGEPRAIVKATRVKPGGEYLFRYPSEKDPAILIRLPNGELHAFSQKCTHLGCVVTYQVDERRLFCPCHDGVFDPATGVVLAGPPPLPLGRIDIEERNGVVWALGRRS
ncbi:MAG: Rieske (2Fe-2S) protein [Acidimicrobiia bacterium]